MGMFETAEKFFEACETGKGWDGCEQYCTDDASFAAEAVALENITTLGGYCDWMAAVYDRMSDVSYELKGFALDKPRSVVMAYGVFMGTPIGEGEQKSVSTNYVYSMEFEGDKIGHVTKIWNDTY
ncbi:nuclear transport factor 2 family protein [Yoonia sp.]|uniref:nuclear transport factor 2 family protein n=1 Tax=Yoonia sp. TaxID=2212373 RepID=UPI0025E4633A|nr:nuclear transport factor 2 family protein [Yoonia sp.]